MFYFSQAWLQQNILGGVLYGEKRHVSNSQQRACAAAGDWGHSPHEQGAVGGLGGLESVLI